MRRLLLAAALLAALAVGCRGRKADVLHVFWASDVVTLDPNARLEVTTDTYALNVFEPLLRHERLTDYVPILATHWDMSDGRSWRFHLRKGVRFHDGSPLSAEDVVFTLERARTSHDSELYPFLTGITSVRALDAETVEIVSDRPAALLSVLSFVYVLPKKTLAARGDRVFFERPVGTGPYRFASWKPKVALELARHDGYWGQRPAFGRAVFHVVGAQEPVLPLAEKSPPAIVIQPSRKEFATRDAHPRLRFLSRPGMSVNYLVANTRPDGPSPMRDVRVRRAVRAAIDYARLLEKATGNQAFAATQFVTPDVIGYNPTLTVPPHRPGEARRLLAEAGHPDGVDLVMNVDRESTTTLNDELVAQLAEEGIRLKVVPLPPEELARRDHRCDGDLHRSGWTSSTGDASELLEANFFGRGAVRERTEGCTYYTPELDELIDAAARSLEPEVRRDLLQQAMKRLVDDLPWIPLLIAYDRYAISPDLVFEPRADGEVRLSDVKLK